MMASSQGGSTEDRASGDGRPDLEFTDEDGRIYAECAGQVVKELMEELKGYTEWREFSLRLGKKDNDTTIGSLDGCNVSKLDTKAAKDELSNQEGFYIFYTREKKAMIPLYVGKADTSQHHAIERFKQSALRSEGEDTRQLLPLHLATFRLTWSNPALFEAYFLTRYNFIFNAADNIGLRYGDIKSQRPHFKKAKIPSDLERKERNV